MISGIYKIINSINNKIYVGSSNNILGRLQRHFKELKNNTHYNKKIQRSFNKHYINNFCFEVIEYVEDFSKLIEREQYYIDTLKPEYNIRLSANSSLGMKASDETKKKISESRIGHFVSDETRKKIGDRHRGKFVSDETKLKMSLAQSNKIGPNKGKIFSEGHRSKMSESMKFRIPHNKGKQTSEDQRRKISEANKGKIPHNKGKKMTEEELSKFRATRLANKLKKNT